MLDRLEKFRGRAALEEVCGRSDAKRLRSEIGAPGVSEGKCTVSPITLGAFQEKEAVYL